MRPTGTTTTLHVPRPWACASSSRIPTMGARRPSRLSRGAHPGRSARPGSFDRIETGRETLAPERRVDRRLDAMLREEPGNSCGVDQHVVVRSSSRRREPSAHGRSSTVCRYEAIGTGQGERGDDRPVLAHSPRARGRSSQLAPLQFAEIAREQRPGRKSSQWLPARDPRFCVGEVLEGMAEADDRVGFQDPVGGQRDPQNRACVGSGLPGKGKHCRRGIGRDHPCPARRGGA